MKKPGEAFVQMLDNRADANEYTKDPQQLKKILARWEQHGSKLIPKMEGNNQVGVEVVMSTWQRAKLFSVVSIGAIASLLMSGGETTSEVAGLYAVSSPAFAVLATILSRISQRAVERLNVPYNPLTIKEEIEAFVANAAVPTLTVVPFAAQNLVVAARGAINIAYNKDIQVANTTIIEAGE